MENSYEVTTDDLHSVLSILKQECERHGFSEQSNRVSQRIRDLNESLLIMVVGEGNFGKSTLINALIGKDVAPVSILPKTWKVDLYEPAQDKEEAWLYMRQNPDKPKKVSIPEAVKICEDEEIKAKSMKDNGQSWKSDLFQVRWSIKAEWPQQKVALVDTPGFSQLRADTSVSDIKLYGSNGIQIAASDAFEYYYYRADIVIWCINGNKVQDQDTLDALAKVHVHDKLIIGVITKMDRIPSDRWDEIKNEAKQVFGKYINNFICTAAGAKDSTKQTTVSDLRGILNSQFTNNIEKSKINAVVSYADDEGDAFLLTLDGIMQCYINNIKKRDKILTSSLSKLQTIHDSTQNELSAVWNSTYNSAVSQLDSIYDRADGDVERFRRLVSEYCINQSDLDRSINRILNNAQQRMQAEGQMVLSRLDWDGVRIGSRSVSSFKIDSNQALAATINFRSKGELNLNLTSGEGVGTGIAVGGAAAAAGAFLLGPIGIAAGLIGFLAGKMMKRSNCTSEATSQISKFCESNSSKIENNFTEAANKYHKQLIDIIEQSFSCHHGKNIDGLINHSFEADNSLNALDLWPKNRSTAIWPSAYYKELPSNYDPLSCYYFNISANDSVQKTNWDEAVLQEWKDTITPYLLKQVFDSSNGAFNDKQLNDVKSKQHKTIKSYITNAVKESDWEVASNGVTIDMKSIISKSTTAKDLRELLPNFDSILNNINTARILKLKSHSISNLRNHFENTYNSKINAVISESLLTVDGKQYELKRYMKSIVATGLLFSGGVISQPWGIIMNMYKSGYLSYQSIESDLKLIWLVALFGISFFILIFMSISSYIALHNKANEDAASCLGAFLSEVRKRTKKLIESGFES